MPSRFFRNRPGLAAFGLALIIGGAGGATAKPKVAQLVQQTLDVTAIPIENFSRQDAGRTHFGRLTWRGGLVLSASAAVFGGYSGLSVGDDGAILAISDAGSWLKATLASRGHRPGALAHVTAGPLLGAKGATLDRSRDRDSEGLAVLPDGKDVLISFERNTRIVRYALDKEGIAAPTGAISLPEATRTLPANKGLESVAVLAGTEAAGAIVTFAEEHRDADGNQTGWIIPPGKAEPVTLKLARTAEFDVTDVAPMPDGGLIILWRSFSWGDGVRMRLERLSPGQIKAGFRGSAMTGELLFEADQGYDIDNMEGVAVSHDKTGKTVLTLISDNNFSWLQRTILLQFTLDEPAVAAQP